MQELFLFVCMLIAGIMIHQHLKIASIKEDHENWNEILRSYRFRIRVAVGVFVFSVVLLAIFLVVIGSNYELFEKYRGLNYLIIFWAFVMGSIRLFVERTSRNGNLMESIKDKYNSIFAHKRMRNRSYVGDFYSGVRGNIRGDNSWFLWFAFSMIVAVFEYVLIEINARSEKAGNDVADVSNIMTLMAYGFLIPCIGFGYFSWTYMLLYRKLTDEHHFSDRAACIFLGDILSDGIPQQSIAIGPPAAGKTTFIHRQSVTEAKERTEITTLPVWRGNNERINLSVIDCPGENMGDHILHPLAFRADSLVLILRAEWLSTTSISRKASYSLDRWEEFIKEDFQYVRTYLKGLYHATKRDGSILDLKEVFKVRSFVLYINCRGKDETLPKEAHHRSFQLLSEAIGERFGVPREDCCCVGGDAIAAGEAIELLGFDPQARLALSKWPGNSHVDSKR